MKFIYTNGDAASSWCFFEERRLDSASGRERRIYDSDALGQKMEKCVDRLE
ncbi:hypothetical protein BELL_0232g00200 [Botrytis elliptica]|uniref:Uncharacterized protein n=1 Tax=Botrytis elliptica TaxID=278938 RepID=A0A4Z1JNK1_9HELO|nr:hypothetical protein BELL_0232g00200 [Botrytis elliptica]